MNFAGLFKQERTVGRIDHGQDDAAPDMILDELSPPPLQDEPDFGIDLEEALAEALADRAEASHAEASAEAGAEHRITPHSQSRLAALSAFEDLTQSERQDLQALGLTLAKVTSNHQLMRGFLTAIHADIHRANEMELSHSRLAAENRKLAHQLDDTQKQLSMLEAKKEALETRVSRLSQEAASLRDALSEARLEVTDAATAILRLEAERADMTTSLAAKSLSVDKLMRENEVMREKQMNLSMDLDAELKAHVESQRRLEELTAVHSSDAARLVEQAARIAHGEKEVGHLQKQHDTLQATVGELNETIRSLQTELDERDERNAADTAGFESEVQSLNARLQENAKTIGQKTEQIDALTAKLNETISDKRIAFERLDALQAENARDKQKLSAAFANFSQLTVLQTSEHVMLDVHKQEAEELRREIGGLEATVKRLAPYEKVYQSSKDRPGKRSAEQGARETPKAAAQAGTASKDVA